MTANLVNGLSSPQNLIPAPAAPTGSSAGTDFSKVLDTSSAKEASKSQNGTDNRDGRLDQTDKVEKDIRTEEKKDIRNKKADEKETESTVSKKDEVEEANVAAEENTPDETDMEQVAEVVATMVQTIAEVLEIPVDKVAEAIEALGLEEMEVLETKNIPTLVTEITGVEDAAAIVTDEELFADVKELMETSDKLVTELATELKIPVDELKDAISKEVNELKDNSKESVVNQNENPEITVEVKDLDKLAAQNEKQGNAKQNASEDRHGNQTVNFGQTVVDTLKASVEEVFNEAPETYSTTSVEDILNQVTESLKTTMKEDITEMEMQLHPASLGNVRIQVAAREGVITANFTTQNEEVKQALEMQIVQLKEQMNEQGIKVEAVEVTVNAHAFERNFNNEHDQSNGQNETEAKKRRVRGINLSGMEMNELDEIDEEDRVTADMMARQGNTVDYLA